MADIFLFIRHGWKSIWKQKSIWLFSALPLLDQFFNIFSVKREANLLTAFISLITGLIYIVLYLANDIGVPYLAYRYLIGNPATIRETLSSVKKFAGRVIGCSCLGLLALSPLYFWVIAISINPSTRTLELSNSTSLWLMSFAAFSALGQFTYIAFFENDWGIRQSLTKAWNLFKNHAGVLATLGVILLIIFKIYSVMIGSLTLLIQSDFDMASLNNLNMINPSESLSKNLLFASFNSIGQIIFTALSASVFVSAYLKYSNVKLPPQMKIK